jgi:broad specificity phosphatase PhoE
MLEIYLARHAAPDWTRTDLIYHLPPGPPLTEEGISQAEALGKFFHHAGVRQIFCSPLERCRHTAEVASNGQIPIRIEEDLAEWKPEESGEVLLTRFWPVFQKAVESGAREGPVALVTHGGPIGSLLAKLGMSQEKLQDQRVFDHHNPVPTAGVWKASREQGEQEWRLELAFIPDTENLPAEHQANITS